MTFKFEKATPAHAAGIWEMLSDAIQRRKADGSKQWQDGYPNPEVVKVDLDKGYGYIMTEDDKVVAYCALMINDEPAYAELQGKWLSDGDFVVFHRVAVAQSHLGRGISKQMLKYIEQFALENNIYSIKADTNYDNAAMLALFEKSGYQYCGEVNFRGSSRKAFEKVLQP